MRKIELTEPDTPEWLQWKEGCAQARTAAIETVGAGGIPAISDLYKAQKAWFREPDGIFLGKCAYCEQNIVGNQHGDVEHYRPKRCPQSEDGVPVERDIDGAPERHPGYYWLAYDINNLLLACIGCNQLTKTPRYGKGNRFPVFGDHAWQPGDESYEEPKLLNPYRDDPRDHIRYDRETGILLGLTERGRATIDILGLNLRDLPQARLRMFEAIEDRFDAILAQRRMKPAGWARDQLAALSNDKKRDFLSVVALALSHQAASVLDAVQEL
jgi:hypothetical protein